MRSGTRTQCKTRWSRKGQRPLCRMKVGYEFCYLYAALCPVTGHLVCLILPDMTKASFCLFCQFFSEQVKALGGPCAVVLICDGAGAHQQEVCLEHGITLKRLPPYCPELNPVERFFEELRKDLSNQVYETIEDAENHLSQILQPYFKNKEKIIQLTNYSYIRTH
jgi:transposase